jgi:hypothetical protein
MIQFIFYLILSYYTIIIFFLLYIFNNKLNKNIIIFKTTSLIKNKEYLLFKDSLFKFYYSTLIVLIVFIFKNNSFNYLLEFNIYFTNLLISIFFNLLIFTYRLL